MYVRLLLRGSCWFFFFAGVVEVLFGGELFIWRRELWVLLLQWLFWLLIGGGEFFFFLLFIYVGYGERLRWAERCIDIFLVMVVRLIPFGNLVLCIVCSMFI